MSNENNAVPSDSDEARGMKWAFERYTDLVATPGLLPEVGKGYTNQLLAARKVQKCALDRLFVGADNYQTMVSRALTDTSEAFWHGALIEGRRLLALACTPPSDAVF